MPKQGQSSFEVEVVRSARRTKTVSGKLVGNTLQIRIPATATKKQEEQWVASLVAKLEKKAQKKPQSDEQLFQRAQTLNATVLEGKADLRSIMWVPPRKSYWGSCDSASGIIRISEALRDVPQYVLDAVIVHELTHTFITTGHSPEFWRWADKAPQAERAKGYLEAWARMLSLGALTQPS
ncbi:MAG: DUF45 domain-containing protein [Corynebacterium sp.]|uniref:M48 metallopeptidase family protein n=1 Tax=Corynebacterium sp. TaxID=1720 RepID=UPI0026DB81EC|nr:YgjP-like metallopeptidase domain-containing protein [Corynebacterium sp.]MDO4761219.1 DUF45 domain-containing protein [Corynebacterium sp.]